jgi:nitric oxide synthase-interacting protein
MSRHSKNNTANSVFTYAERQKLAKDYGSAKSRIGQDSQRTFEQCHLCLTTANEPVCCLEGHIFCKDCIMSNMLEQKKALKQAAVTREHDQLREDTSEVLKKRNLESAEISNFEKDAFELGSSSKLKEHLKEFKMKAQFTEEDYVELKRQRTIQNIKDQKPMAFDDPDVKNGMVQTSFWMAEADKERKAQLDKAGALEGAKSIKPERMICPGDNKHSIKLKDFFHLKFENGGFLCYASKKQLKFQKIIGLRTCGHVYIAEEFDRFVQKESQKCYCGKEFLEGDIIKIEPAHSAFSKHNSVEAKVYQPHFAV